MKPVSTIKALETSLVLAGAFLVLYFLKSNEVFIYISFGCIVTGVFIKPLARWIAFAWLKFGDMLGFVVSKVILGALFYFLLFPISLFYRLFKKDPLQIKHSGQSTWIERNHSYTGKDMENIW